VPSYYVLTHAFAGKARPTSKVMRASIEKKEGEGRPPSTHHMAMLMRENLCTYNHERAFRDGSKYLQ